MKLRDLPKREIVWGLLAVVLIGGVASYFGAKYVIHRRAMTWREEGLAAARAERHPQAVALLARYLRRNPKDVDALAAYAKSRELVEMPNGQHLAETAGALKMLINLQPDRLDDRRHLLELYAKLDRRPEAIDIANAILAKNPRDARTLELKTDVLIASRQYREALQAAEKWREAAPDSVRAVMSHMTMRSLVGQAAREIVGDAQKLRDARPNEAQYELLLGYAYAITGNREKAIEWYRAAARHIRPTDEFLRILVRQMDSQGLAAETLPLLQDWARANGGSEVRHMLAARLWERNQWDQVASSLADLDLKDRKTDATLIGMRAYAQHHLRDAADLAACRAALGAQDQPVAKAWAMLLSRLVDATQVDDNQLSAVLQAAVAREPQNVYLDFFLGDATLRIGELDLAVEAWTRAATRDLTWGLPASRLSDLLLMRDRPIPAFEAARAAVRRNPSSVGAAIALVRAWAACIDAGHTGGAEDLLKSVTELLKQLPEDNRLQAVRIQALAQAGKKDEAVEAIRSAIRRDPPPDEQFFLLLAGTSARNELGVEEDCYATAEKAHGLTPTLAYAWALGRAAKGDRADATKWFDTLLERSGKSSDLNWRLARAHCLDVLGDPAAKAAWVELGDAYPKDRRVQQAIVATLSVRGEREFMQRSIERLKALTGEKGLAWRLARARYLVEAPGAESDWEQASLLLRGVVQSYPRLPEARVLLARALLLLKRDDAAIEQLTTASELDPTSQSIPLQLARLLQSRGDFDRAREILDRVLPKLQSESRRYQAAVLLAQQGRPERAVQLLEDLRGQEATQTGLLLAMLYRQNAQYDKVEATLKKLLETPDAATLQFAASFYRFRNRAAEAEQALGRLDALKLAPGVKEMAWATYHAQAGDYARAAARYREALRVAPNSSSAWISLAACEAAMGQWSQFAGAVDEATRALPADPDLAALKPLAPVLVEAGAEPHLRPVIISVIRNPRGSEDTVELLRTMAELRRDNNPEQAAARLQQLADQRPQSLAIQMELARAHMRLSRASQALAVARKAMVTFPTDPAPAQFAVELAAQSERWQDLLVAAQAWKKRAPAAAAMADLAMAQAYLGLKQHDSAIAQVQPYLAAAKADPSQMPQVLALHTQALAESGRAPEAADLLWPLTTKDVRWRIHWMRIASGSLDAAQGRTWLERVEATISPTATNDRVMLATAYDSLGRRHKDPALIQKATSLFSQAANNPDATAAVVLAAAMQAERSNDLAAAEPLYRRVVQLDAKSSVALNNLAMVLIQRNGNMAEATQLARAAVQAEPSNAAMHDTLALVQSRSGDLSGAIESMRTATRLEPDNAKWYVPLAAYLMDANRVAEAAKVVAELDARRLDLQRLSPEARQQLNSVRTRLRPVRTPTTSRAP